MMSVCTTVPTPTILKNTARRWILAPSKRLTGLARHAKSMQEHGSCGARSQRTPGKRKVSKGFTTSSGCSNNAKGSASPSTGTRLHLAWECLPGPYTLAINPRLNASQCWRSFGLAEAGHRPPNVSLGNDSHTSLTVRIVLDPSAKPIRERARGETWRAATLPGLPIQAKSAYKKRARPDALQRRRGVESEQ